MDKNNVKVSKNVKVSNGQGPELTKEQFIEAVGRTTVEDVRTFLKKDLSTCIHMLDAIYRDVNTFNALADYLHGRLMNAKHQEELKKQQELDLN